MMRVLTSFVSASLLGLPLFAFGQAEPAGPGTSNTAAVSNTMPGNNFGFNLPTHLGTLSYSLSGSEMMETGFGNGSVDASTALSGNLAYMSTSDRNPFSLVYSGGYVFTGVPGNSSSETFQDLAVSQVVRTRSWVFVVSDGFDYLPDAPTTGLSGVAGVGDIGVYPVQTGLGPAQSILTNRATSIGNGLQGSATWQMTPSVDLQASAAWQILDYVDTGNVGLNTNSYSATFGPTDRIDARNSLGIDAYYTRSTYPGYAGYVIETEGANINYTRAWSRRFSTTVGFGPETTHGTTFTAIPAKLNFAGSATANYATRTTGFYAMYSRAVNSGSGIIFGALSDTVTFGLTRPLSRDWEFGASASYSRSVGLAPYMGLLPRYDAVFGAAQISRRLTESLSAFGSYTAIEQSSQNNVYGPNAFNGLNHVISVGITFAPAPLVRGR